jgi:hypothetical protein
MLALMVLPVLAQERPFDMEVGLRGRYMAVPNGIIDSFVFSHKDDAFPDRPSIWGVSGGLEFVIRNQNANGIFYVEYLFSGIKEGYWDDVESPPDFDDGSYLVPERLGLVNLGANGAYEIHANSWFSFLFGGGLGLGILTGQLTEWEPGEDGSGESDNTDPDCGPTEPAYDRKDHCADDGALGLPPVVPLVDMFLAVRFHMGDRATLRLEGGLHDMLYTGMSVGVKF